MPDVDVRIDWESRMVNHPDLGHIEALCARPKSGNIGACLALILKLMPRERTRIYMGFENPLRIQLDSEAVGLINRRPEDMYEIVLYRNLNANFDQLVKMSQALDRISYTPFYPESSDEHILIEPFPF